jgi:tetratricopeptide (TPR) repeat protein
MRTQVTRLAALLPTVLVALSIGASIIAPARAQNFENQRGTLKGTVVDEAGKPVAGIVVLLSTSPDMKSPMEAKTNPRGFMYPRLGDEIRDYYIGIKSDEYFIRKITILTRRANDEIWQDNKDVVLTPDIPTSTLKVMYRMGANIVNMTLAKLADFKSQQTQVVQAAAEKKEISIDAQIAEKESLGEYKEAADLLQKTIQENPADPLRRWQHAQMLAKAGQGTEAIKEARKAIAIKPEMTGVRPKLSQWVFEDGATDEAIALLEKEKELDAANPDVYRRLGGVYHEAGRKDDEKKSVAKWAELAPDDPEALVALAGVKVSSNDFAAAEQIYRKLAEKDPANAYKMFYNVGLSIWNAKGDVNNAIAALRKSVELKPDYPNSHKMLGDCLLNLGKLAEARQAYQKFLDLAPGDPQAGDIKKTIQGLPQK